MHRDGVAVTTEYDDLLALAVELALEAGALVRQGRIDGLVDVETKSTATDAVTEYDRPVPTTASWARKAPLTPGRRAFIG